MKKAELIALGMTEEQAEAALVIHGKDIEKFKTDLDAVKVERDGLKTSLTEANDQIAKFGDKDATIEQIKAQADEYKTKFEEAEKTSADNIKKIKLDHAIEGKLTEAKAKDIKSLRVHLDESKILFDEEKGTFTGLNEQLETIKTDKPFLFSDGKEIKISTQSNSKSVTGDALVDAARQAAGLNATPATPQK